MLGFGLQLLLFLLLRPHDYQVTLFIQCHKCHNQFGERCVDLNHNYCHVGKKFLKICKTVISQGIWYCSLLYTDLLSKRCNFYVFSISNFGVSKALVALRKTCKKKRNCIITCKPFWYPFGFYRFPVSPKAEFTKSFGKSLFQTEQI